MARSRIVKTVKLKDIDVNCGWPSCSKHFHEKEMPPGWRMLMVASRTEGASDECGHLRPWPRRSECDNKGQSTECEIVDRLDIVLNRRHHLYEP